MSILTRCAVVLSLAGMATSGCGSGSAFTAASSEGGVAGGSGIAGREAEEPSSGGSQAEAGTTGAGAPTVGGGAGAGPGMGGDGGPGGTGGLGLGGDHAGGSAGVAGVAGIPGGVGGQAGSGVAGGGGAQPLGGAAGTAGATARAGAAGEAGLGATAGTPGHGGLGGAGGGGGAPGVGGSVGLGGAGGVGGDVGLGGGAGHAGAAGAAGSGGACQAGVPCGPSVGECRSLTVCEGETEICVGTFVAPSPIGSPEQPGTQAEPVATLSAGLANAARLGGGTDVCVCAAPSQGAATFTEDVTMVQGTSLIGGYNCDNWEQRDPDSFETVIENTTALGVKVPAGITGITRIDGFTINGLDVSDAASSAAVTVTDSSPELVDNTINSGSASLAVGLHVESTGLNATGPQVIRGSVRAAASGAGSAEAIGIRIDGATVSIIDTVVDLTDSAAGTATGIECNGCPSSVISPQQVLVAGATNVEYGILAAGNLSQLVIELAEPALIAGGGAVESTGIAFRSCDGGTPLVTGPGGILGGTGSGATNIGISSEGACAPRIEEVGGIRGCPGDVSSNPSTECVGISCSEASACTILRNADVSGGPAVSLAIGVRCAGGACSNVAGNFIHQDTLAGQGGIGLYLDGSSPSVDANQIVGPACTGGSVARPGQAVLLVESSARLTNNVIRQGTCAGYAVDVQGGTNLGGGATLHSNTIEGGGCSGANVGIHLVAEEGAPPMTEIRNNIIRGLELSCPGNPLAFVALQEANAQSDPSIVQNNDFFHAPLGLYVDEGSTVLTTAAQINGLGDLVAVGDNLSVNPGLDTTWHLTNTSQLIDQGIATNAPRTDFDDGGMRPAGDGYDIGADEFGSP